MPKNQHLEIELKFEAPHDLSLPESWPEGLYAAEKAEYDLSARYFDTKELALAKQGIALRLRLGGHDAGWHIKKRVHNSAQQEWMWPVSEELPAEARQVLSDISELEIHEVLEFARINTLRTAILLADGDGIFCYEIVRDFVRACDKNSGVWRSWCEWEAEVLTDEQHLLPQIRQTLLAAGAQSSLADSKIARASGSLLPRALRKGAAAKILAALSILDLADRIDAYAYATAVNETTESVQRDLLAQALMYVSAGNQQKNRDVDLRFVSAQLRETALALTHEVESEKQ